MPTKTLEERKAWLLENRDRINARRRERHADNPAQKAASDARHRARVKERGVTDKERARDAEDSRKYRQRHPEKVKASRKTYMQTDAGRALKKRMDATYAATGARVRYEAKRSAQPVSAARLACRKKWAKEHPEYAVASRSRRRALDKSLPSFDRWVLMEAAHLARLREQLVGGKWHVDHVVPVSKGGTSHAHNIQVVPAGWNVRKSNKHTHRYFGAY